MLSHIGRRLLTTRAQQTCARTTRVLAVKRSVACASGRAPGLKRRAVAQRVPLLSAYGLAVGTARASVCSGCTRHSSCSS